MASAKVPATTRSNLSNRPLFRFILYSVSSCVPFHLAIPFHLEALCRGLTGIPVLGFPWARKHSFPAMAGQKKVA
jgi:hypothetical protein